MMKTSNCSNVYSKASFQYSRHTNIKCESNRSLLSSPFLTIAITLNFSISVHLFLISTNICITVSLIEELEDISTSASSRSHDSQNQSENGTLDLLDSFPRGWTVSCAVKMGIRYGSIVECLMQLLDRWSTRIPEKHTHLLSSICFAILEWKRCYLRYNDHRECL